MTNENTEIEFTVLGEPMAKGRPRFTRKGFAYTPKETREAEGNMRAQIVAQLPKDYTPLQEAISMRVVFVRTKPKSTPKKVIYPTTKGDLDNYIKTVLDSMNTVVFRDDAQIVHLLAIKKYGNPPMTIINMEEMR